MAEWKSKLILADGHYLVKTSSSSEGFMSETDIETYDILSKDGQLTGRVVFKEHTAVRGFRRTLSIEQRNTAGEVIIRDSWTA